MGDGLRRTQGTWLPVCDHIPEGGGRRSNHRLTGVRRRTPGQERGMWWWWCSALRTPNACFRSVLLSSFCPVSGGVLGYRQPQRHTDFRRCVGESGLETQLQSSPPSVVKAQPETLSDLSISPAVKCEVAWPSPWTDFTELSFFP